MAADHNIDIQMKRKELTKIFMMISNWKKTLALFAIKHLQM